MRDFVVLCTTFPFTWRDWQYAKDAFSRRRIQRVLRRVKVAHAHYNALQWQQPRRWAFAIEVRPLFACVRRSASLWCALCLHAALKHFFCKCVRTSLFCLDRKRKEAAIAARMLRTCGSASCATFAARRGCSAVISALMARTHATGAPASSSRTRTCSTHREVHTVHMRTGAHTRTHFRVFVKRANAMRTKTTVSMALYATCERF